MNHGKFVEVLAKIRRNTTTISSLALVQRASFLEPSVAGSVCQARIGEYQHCAVVDACAA